MPLICFASPKGGVGKSTIAANVAFELARTGWSVLALDLDPQNSLRLHFGMSLHDRDGFMHVLPSRPDWRSALRPTSSGVWVLPFGAIDMAGAVGLSARLIEQPALLSAPLREMLARPDVAVILDTEPGPSASLATVLPAVDLLVNVLLVDPMSAAQIPAISSGRAYGADWASADDRQGFVLNGFDPRTRLGPSIVKGLSRHAGVALLGVVHKDEYVSEAAAAQRLVAQYAAGAQAASDIGGIARAISGRLAAGSARQPDRRRAMAH